MKHFLQFPNSITSTKKKTFDKNEQREKFFEYGKCWRIKVRLLFAALHLIMCYIFDNKFIVFLLCSHFQGARNFSTQYKVRKKKNKKILLQNTLPRVKSFFFNFYYYSKKVQFSFVYSHQFILSFLRFCCNIISNIHFNFFSTYNFC